MTHGTMVRTGDGMIHGTTEDIGADGTTHGITEDTGEDGTTPDTTLITDGMIHIGDTTITTVRATSMRATGTFGMDQGTRQAPTGSSQAHPQSEAESATEAQSAEASLPYVQAQRP